MMIEKLEEMRPLSETARISGYNAQTIKSHIKRGNVVAQGERIIGGGGRGNRRGYSFATVTELRFARELIEGGIVTDLAFKIAQEFAHFGGSEAAAYRSGPAPITRIPSLPYHHALGETFVCAAGDKVKVTLVRRGQDFGEVLERDGLDEPLLIRLDAWPLYSDLMRQIECDPFKTLNDAYDIHSGADLERFD